MGNVFVEITTLCTLVATPTSNVFFAVTSYFEEAKVPFKNLKF